jgi:hypothetical protein
VLRDPSLIPLSHQHHNGLPVCVITNRSLDQDPSPENRVEESDLFEEAQKLLPREVLDQIGAEIDRRVVRICL